MLLFAALWLALLAAACPLDAPIARAVNGSKLENAARHGRTRYIFRAMKLPGDYRTWLVVAAVLWVVHPIHWQAAGFLSLSGVLGGLNSLLKWSIGRMRPFKFPPDDALMPFSFRPFQEGFPSLFHQGDLAFPSGHSMIAFAAAAAMTILVPRGRRVFYAIAAIVAFERVAENAHYLTDTIGAAGIAILGIHSLWHLCKRVFPSADEHARKESITLTGRP